MCAKHNHKYRIKLGKLNYVCPFWFLLVLKNVSIVLPRYQKNAVFNQNFIFFTNQFTVRYSNSTKNARQQLGADALFLSISAHLSLCPLPANLHIYKQVWIYEKLWLSTDGRKFQWNDSGFAKTTRQFEQIQQG